MSSSALSNIITNAVIDLSHWNNLPDMPGVKAGGIFGIIHKATQGLNYVDPAYITRRTQALAAGLAWGGYHFGTGDDPTGQADHFLNTIQPDSKTLIALDLERNSNGPSMNRVQAEAFVARVQAQTGRWPVLYTGHWYLREIMSDSQPTTLTTCPLWIASYQPTPDMPPQWASWTLWQYTDGTHGSDLHEVPTMGPCDRDKFSGSPADLTRFWGITS